MEPNGTQEKRDPLTVGSGPPPRYFGIPEEPWEEGAHYVMRRDGRQVWLERVYDRKAVRRLVSQTATEPPDFGVDGE